MENLDDLLKYENEHTMLDFKAIEYKKDKFTELLKDVMSMANNQSKGDGRIVFGVKVKSNGHRDFIGLDSENMTDAATYQQLVEENIEPSMEIEYNPYRYKDVKLGILKIKSCNNPPYMMKKDYGALTKGDSFIRIGTHTRRLTRTDFDKIQESKIQQPQFIDEIKIWFTGTTYLKDIELNTIEIVLPSDEQAERIKEIIKKKENDPLSGLSNTLPSFPLYRTTYEERGVDTLKENLKNVKQAYQEDDLYEIYEKNSHKLNLSVLNTGQEYLFNCSIEVRIEKTDGLIIAPEVRGKPIPNDKYEITTIAKGPSYEELNYPCYKEDDTHYIYFEDLGDLRHNISQELFEFPILIKFLKGIQTNRVLLEMKIFGKNLAKPIEDQLTINIKD